MKKFVLILLVIFLFILIFVFSACKNKKEIIFKSFAFNIEIEYFNGDKNIKTIIKQTTNNSNNDFKLKLDDGNLIVSDGFSYETINCNVRNFTIIEQIIKIDTIKTNK